MRALSPACKGPVANATGSMLRGMPPRRSSRPTCTSNSCVFYPGHGKYKRHSSVTIMLVLEWTRNGKTQIARLIRSELRQLGPKRGQMQPGDLLVELLREEVDLILVGLCLLPVLEQVELRKNLVSFHAGLEGANRVNLCDQDAGPGPAHGEGAALANVTIAADKHALPTDHDIGGTHDSVGQRMTAAIHVVDPC